MQPTLLCDCRCELGEGAFWHPGLEKLCWVDIGAHTLHWCDPSGSRHGSRRFDEPVTKILPASDGKLILALGRGLARYDLQKGSLEWLTAIGGGEAGLRCNDGHCDAAGRLWIGIMHEQSVPGAGALYCVHPDLRVEKKLDKVSVPNGIAWSPDGKRMFFIDSARRCVASYHYDPDTAGIAFERTAIRIPAEAGLPDGMAMDEEGKLWICHWGGGGVYRWDPRNGSLLDKICLQAPQVTSCAFSGDGLRALVITTARKGLSAGQLQQFPLSGSVFHVSLPVKGVPVTPFAG